MEIQQQLENQEETALNLQDTYVSLQQEVEIKTKKLKRVRDGAVYAGCPAILLFWSHPIFPTFFVLVRCVLFQNSMNYGESVCITCTIVKFNIFP